MRELKDSPGGPGGWILNAKVMLAQALKLSFLFCISHSDA